MALTPNIVIPVVTQNTLQSSKTYALDFDTGEIKGMVDGRKAIEQFIRKAIVTIRFIHPIYTDAYGCEVRNMIGKGFSDSFLKSEIKRMVTEALIYDSRVNSVYDFNIRINGDDVFIGFWVDTVEGTFDMDVSI
ncbi:MAG: phage protein [Pelosinus sp.]|jgi:hypothetical protein|nr:phage protein [Pelosinus sp.]